VLTASCQQKQEAAVKSNSDPFNPPSNSEPKRKYATNDNAATESYDAFVGTHGSPVERERRAAQWRADHPNDWHEVLPEPDQRAPEKAKWAYRTTNEKKSVAVNPVDSRPAREGYDHFNFDHQHPALRR
jgi:hypothetical protein